MGALNDDAYDFYGGLGHTGSLQDRELKWLKSRGVNTWRELFAKEGYSMKSLPDLYYEMLKSAGFSGTLNDMWKQYFALDSDLAIYPHFYESSLVLDFINQKYFVNKIEKTFSNIITFTRSTTAIYFDSTGVLQTAAINIPRFDYNPVTFTPKGLLIEEARTNSLLHCRDLANAVWVKTNTTAVKNAIGLDGITNSASTLTATGATGTCLQTLTLAAAARSYSVYIKRKTGIGAVSITRDNVSYTDITAQINSSSYTRVKIENTSVLNPVCGIKLATSGDEVLVDFNQDEAGAFITSVVATTVAAATRAADIVSMTGTNFSDWHNATEGTYVVEYAPTNAQHYAILESSDANNWFGIFQNAAGEGVKNRVRIAGAITESAVVGTFGAKTAAAALKASSYGISVLGSAVTVGPPTATVPITSSLFIGQFVTGTAFIDGTVQQIKYFPKRLSNIQLVALSS